MDTLLKIGKECGLQGKELFKFIKEEQAKEEEKEKQRVISEREERAQQRELERLKLEKEEKEKERERELEKLKFEREEKEKQIEREEKEKQRELELEKIKIEKEEREREKERQFQLERERNQAEIELRKLQITENQITNQESVIRVPDYSKSPKLPTFSDGKDKIDSYLERFERFATISNWEANSWATKLSALLTGTALDVYTRLPRDDANDYEELKKALLRRYNLTEEGYRLKFRDCKPEEGETPSQFVDRLLSYIEKWIELSGNEKEYESLRDLIVKEQFVNACPKDLAAYLREQETQNLLDIAKTAERYLSAHDQTLAARRPPRQNHNIEQRRQFQAPTNNNNGQRTETKCFICNRLGHKAAQCRSGQIQNRSNRQESWNRQQNPNYNNQSKQSPQYKVASVVPYEDKNIELRNEKFESDQATLQEIRSLMKEGQVELKNGKSIKLFDEAAVSKRASESQRTMPVLRGWVENKEVNVLRDTGCSGVIVKKSLVPPEKFTGDVSLVLLADSSVSRVPMAKIEIKTPFYSGEVEAMCMSTPVYDLLVGNIEGVRAAENPMINYEQEECAAVTRAQAKKEGPKPLKVAESVNASIVNREKLIELQKADESLSQMKSKKKNEGKGESEVSFEEKAGVMYRIFKKPDVNQGKPIRQVLVPESLRKYVMEVAHDSIMGGHLGIRKTIDRIQATFYWPGIMGDVTRFCRSCDICQKTVPKGKIPKAPLQSMPIIDSPFKRVAIDLVGPISPPSEEGHRYVLTLIDYATRYPEAIPLKKIDTETVAEALVDMFSRLGIPEEILSDLGTQFVSDCMEEVNRLLSIKHLTTTPFHPACNGLVEKFNGVMKSMLKKLCKEQPRQWNRFINALLFAYREVPQESTGFSPFELLYGRTVRGPMHILKQLWTNETETTEVKNSYQYVFELREKLEETLKIAREGIEKSQKRAKHYYDKKAKSRKFKPSDKVLILLPTDHNKLLMQWKGPFEVESVVGLNDYKVKVGSKLKTYHANLLKLYVEREQGNNQEPICQETVALVEETFSDEHLLDLGEISHKETIEDIEYGKELENEQKSDIQSLVKEFKHLFDPKPGNTDIVEHSIKLTSDVPVHCKPYKIPYQTREELKKDIQEMIDLKVIRESDSPYASPTVIVKKPDGTNRVCIDYRRLNKLTVFDPEPMPTAEELFQKLSGDRYFSKVDLSKGYWQIKIPEEDIPKTGFVTPDGHWEFLRMPFGMVNSGATLKKGLKRILGGMKNVEYYWDDILVHTKDWNEHLTTLRELLHRLSEANLTIRPSKCIFGSNNVDFIGHQLKNGLKGLRESNVEKIKAAPRPTTKKQVRSFLGLANYYRDFIPNFAAITAPLTELTRKGKPNNVVWKDPQERAYKTVKELLSKDPVLHLPDPSKTFTLRTDASDEGIGAVLMQEYDGKLFPVSYASKKLSPAEKNYSTIEKECLAVVWSIKKFELYLQGVNFVLQTDHQPLVYLDKAKFINSRIMRWAMFLQNFSIKIESIKGLNNVGADFLSRVFQN